MAARSSIRQIGQRGEAGSTAGGGSDAPPTPEIPHTFTGVNPGRGQRSGQVGPAGWPPAHSRRVSRVSRLANKIGIVVIAITNKATTFVTGRCRGRVS